MLAENAGSIIRRLWGALHGGKVMTALITASMNGQLDVVQALIAANADINDKEYQGVTALVWASWRGHLEVVQALIAAKADINARNNIGETALMWASERGHLEVVQALIAAKAGINDKDNGDNTALMMASERGHLEVVQALIAANANINDKNSDDWSDSCLRSGMTALMLASEEGHLKVVQALIAAKADINTRSYQGMTALMWASQNGHLKVVQALIAAKADINLKDKCNNTALILASEKIHIEVVHALSTANAHINILMTISNNSENIRKILCHSCGDATDHNIINSRTVPPDFDDDHEWCEVHHFAQCMDCKSYTYAISSLNIYEQETRWRSFPSIKTRLKVMIGTCNIPQRVRTIYNEVIDAMNADLPVLSAIGMRSMIEVMCRDDIITFTHIKNIIELIYKSKSFNKKSLTALYRLVFM